MKVEKIRKGAKTAEAAKFDMIFFADTPAVRVAQMDALSRSAQYVANFEPLTLVSALAFLTLPWIAPLASPLAFLAIALVWTATSSALRAPPLVLIGNRQIGKSVV